LHEKYWTGKEANERCMDLIPLPFCTCAKIWLCSL